MGSHNIPVPGVFPRTVIKVQEYIQEGLNSRRVIITGVFQERKTLENIF